MPRAGLLLGRSPESDVILTDPAASQRHAILLGSAAGLQLFPLAPERELRIQSAAALRAVIDEIRAGHALDVRRAASLNRP